MRKVHCWSTYRCCSDWGSDGHWQKAWEKLLEDWRESSMALPGMYRKCPSTDCADREGGSWASNWDDEEESAVKSDREPLMSICLGTNFSCVKSGSVPFSLSQGPFEGGQFNGFSIMVRKGLMVLWEAPWTFYNQTETGIPDFLPKVVWWGWEASTVYHVWLHDCRMGELWHIQLCVLWRSA